MLVGWFLIYFELFDVIQKRFWQRGRYVGQMTMFLYIYTNTTYIDIDTCIYVNDHHHTYVIRQEQQ